MTTGNEVVAANDEAIAQPPAPVARGLCAWMPGALPLLPVLLAIAPALIQLVPLLSETPLSRDHPSHMFKAWHFWNEMLGRGRMRGWSHFWGFGFPVDELSPSGAEVWIALFRAVTFAQLSWTRTYALAFGGFRILQAFAAYRFGRHFLGTAAGVLTAWLTLVDPGAMLEGGWEWYAQWGVWPVSLAMCFVLLAFVRLDRVLRLGRRGDVIAGAVWAGAALFTHQLALIAFAITGPLFLFDRLVRSDRPSMTRVVGAVLGLATGFALAGFFVIPFLARSGATLDLGLPSDSLGQVSKRLLELQTFRNVWAPIHALALVGALFAVMDGVVGGGFLVLSAGALVMLSSDMLTQNLHLERALASVVKIEPQRMLLVAKLFWFPLAAYGLVRITRVRWRPAWRWSRSRAFRWALGLGIGGVLLGPGLRDIYQREAKKHLQGEKDTPFWNDLRDVWTWSQRLRTDSHDEHYRIAYRMWRHVHLPLLAPVYDETLLYKIGYTPSQTFNEWPMSDEPELLEALSVKYVVSSEELATPSLVLERRFGGLWVYRFTQYRSEPFTMMGDGSAELVEFQPELIRIRLRGTTAQSRLKVHVANYPRWQATLSGKQVPITAVPVYGAEYPILMEVPANGDELVMKYVYRGADWAGLCFSLGALPALALLLWFGRRSAALHRARAMLERSQVRIAWCALAGTLALALFLGIRTFSRVRLLPADSVFQQVKASDITLAGGVRCYQQDPLVFQCGAHTLQADVVAGMFGKHLCMSAPDAGELRIRWQTTLGSFVAARYDPEDGPAGSIAVSIDGAPLGTVATRPAYLLEELVQFDTRSRANEQATLELLVQGAALHCFDLRLVR